MPCTATNPAVGEGLFVTIPLGNPVDDEEGGDDEVGA